MADRDDAATLARHIVLEGRVQGVGFRPFVYRLARELNLGGWVRNDVGRVSLLVQGSADAVRQFCEDLIDRAPPLAEPRIVSDEAATGEISSDFSILDSDSAADAHIFVPNDHDTCSDCLAELHDPDDRRHRYPFINCTNCGPRYTLITAMPYDRANTTMHGFALCPACHDEYTSPADRRFHAEPVACPHCGPSLHFRSETHDIRSNDDALAAAVDALCAGQIVAVRGIGGYHLLCDATSEHAVQRLRTAKGRPTKPLAVMFPPAGDDGLDTVRASVDLTSDEAASLAGTRRPIVLARRRADDALAPSIAPGLDELGVFLPYSPLHHLLMAAVQRPLVATSGNVSGEPVLIDIDDADTRLARVADAFVHHDRPIARPADDPVMRTLDGHPRPIRLGRGTAPLERTLPVSLDTPVLAVGGQMKGAIALAFGDRVVVSPHIGEMDSPRSLEVFETLVSDLQSLYGVRAERVVCDAHPGYATHRWARRCGLPLTTVAHHHAHASALWGEHPGDDPMLVFTWDGVGLGTDGTLWGGETFVGRAGAWRRIASFRPFSLPGGERAGREPWRSAAGLCWEVDRQCPVGPSDAALVRQAWQRGVNSPTTSAVGRLFDAAAAIVLGIEAVSHEAEGPMRLEAAAGVAGTEPVSLPVEPATDGVAIVDWAPLLFRILDHRINPAQRAATFHDALARNILDQARRARAEFGATRVGLGGGVFQNRRLTDQAAHRLRDDGFTVLLATSVPCNDGGLCFGQVVEAAAGSAR